MLFLASGTLCNQPPRAYIDQVLYKQKTVCAKHVVIETKSG